MQSAITIPIRSNDLSCGSDGTSLWIIHLIPKPDVSYPPWLQNWQRIDTRQDTEPLYTMRRELWT
jgi:hypothetical protein